MTTKELRDAIEDVITCANNWGHQVCDGHDMDEHWRETIRVIRAAPELLAACRSCLVWLPADGLAAELTIPMLTKAIAKAEGKSP